MTVKEEGRSLSASGTGQRPGIRGEDMETIFFDGYSTKFDARTGNVQRGVGLTVVEGLCGKLFSRQHPRGKRSGQVYPVHADHALRTRLRKEAMANDAVLHC